ncbi:MAG: cytochrome c oxidase accessory protein CcoG [Burkholderiales bacterium]|nr:cytochrome c oxidase accessory protein CcoG [Burkholderiales bacterium]
MAGPQSAAPEALETSLYEIRRKIYPRAVSGWFAGWRVLLVLVTQIAFYGGAWLTWNDRQAILFDLVARKFHIFGLVFWPQDFIFLTALLIISAYALFLFTAVAGRLWCGYACPQTVYTEIFMWIERHIEGDRVQRMRLDQQPPGARKFGLKAAKHGAWIALSLWTGFTFVGYFTPIRTLASSFAAWTLGPWETFWIFFYAFATYGNAGWMREQVCKYMCPYARFQSVMFDPDTLVITYDAKRGETRGSRGRKADPKALGLGDCVDCNVCVQVCPTGIDIRNGLQYECIGCAACIDGCNQVMDKMGYPRGLIRYSTENAVNGKYADADIPRHVARPRVLVYVALLAVIIVAFFGGLWLRSPLKVDVMRDRGALVRDAAGGRLENVYRLQFINADEVPRRYVVSASGLRGLEVVLPQGIEVPAASTRVYPVLLRLDPAGIAAGSHPVTFHVSDADRPEVRADENSRFYIR